MQSWRPNTLNQYNVYLKKWISFCSTQDHQPLERNDLLCLEFLRRLLKFNYSYSAINSARSALSCIFDNPPFGELPLVTRFMKSVYNIKPHQPRYHKTWDVSTVLKYLEKCSPAKFLSRQQLSYKLVTLLALVTGQRVQTLHALNLDFCHFTQQGAIFNITTILKHSSPKNKCDNKIFIPYFGDNRKICPITCLKQYIERTISVRQSQQLFLGVQKPFKPVSKSTLSRWIKTTLSKAGINTDVFKSHSTRAASSSAAAESIDISLVLKAGNWSRASTFHKYYHKEVEEDRNSFGKEVLKKLQVSTIISLCFFFLSFFLTTL